MQIAAAGSTSDIDNNFAYQTHQIYRERKLSDHFHKFAEICMERYDRLNEMDVNHNLMMVIIFSIGIQMIDRTLLNYKIIRFLNKQNAQHWRKISV